MVEVEGESTEEGELAGGRGIDADVSPPDTSHHLVNFPTNSVDLPAPTWPAYTHLSHLHTHLAQLLTHLAHL